jgi:hypothetical protein
VNLPHLISDITFSGKANHSLVCALKWFSHSSTLGFNDVFRPLLRHQAVITGRMYFSSSCRDSEIRIMGSLLSFTPIIAATAWHGLVDMVIRPILSLRCH